MTIECLSARRTSQSKVLDGLAAALVADDKARIVEETLAPGAKVTEVARRNGIAASVVFTWRRQARTAERVGPCFAPAQIAAAVETGEENSKPPSEGDRRMRQLPFPSGEGRLVGLVQLVRNSPHGQP
jgi:hypothetical protein